MSGNHIRKHYLFLDTYFLFVFILLRICFILFNPSKVKCDLFSINLVISLKSNRSKFLLPFKGYLAKKGIMISFILENLVTLKSIVPLESKLVLPHPKYSIKLLIRDSSLIL
ncbi:hypothetical protein COCC4DRAFT_76829 [Bipolaris maydis ATCC 48331]|uniref:Uncharacterized protein n=3 Tax=Bipolaris TaxID=33194 RepID=W6XN75_COCC2|nr:uncharacterized protein COCCADRAFT_113593 [Bipolaris zeicola 26-R-13]XP_014072911.1 uncharacterized protein COCC4DRAFT_76829 [Bipolaris maydis ATCC 48331]ENH99020.1 hypothetical protein COCC4DRAFT_76829 [Bipolaris maydis ATCC 48331]EUC26705.1 hypothetical protein COCCADRAFT_113593 [Bipolaris zeicola 26-R-13]